MIAEERASYILKRLQERETLSLKDIARELSVSEATVRRDFQKLENWDGWFEYIAAPYGQKEAVPSACANASIPRKPEINVAAKQAVAQRAAAFVNDGDCIFLDGGTSLAPMAACLGGKKIKIVTHNLLIPQYLTDTQADVFIVGGYYRPYHATTVGHYAEKMIAQFHFDHAFFGCSGIDLRQQMAYNNDIDTIPVKEAAMQYSAHNYLLIDASKFDTTAYCRFSKLSAFDHVICNRKEGMQEYPGNFIVI